ncbi:MAG: KEOPS complex kinase/ATPase Bud32 [Thermoplasmata archaeon]|nr:KEOPS complex kinase/ATPase Bud32 [Thermoplasmata archaeon]
MDSHEDIIIARGAEAVLTRSRWHNRDVVVKERVTKAYRVKELDSRLRESRTKSEAQLMAQARKAGVKTPLVYDIDLVKCIIVMEFIEGLTAKMVLQELPNREQLALEIGKHVGRLHRADIVHGDLTTSNIIFQGQEPCFIDFGLGEKSHEIEKKGVDMHLLKEALSSAHSEHEHLYNAVACGYTEEYPEGERILALVEEIENRGRYT